MKELINFLIIKIKLQRKKMLIKKVFYLLLFFSSMNLYSQEKYKEKMIGNNPALPTIAFVITGGTVAETQNPKTKASVLGPLDTLIKNLQLLTDLANIKMIEFSNIDSSQMTPEIWGKLSLMVDKVLMDDNITAAVISHGTDTMAQGAYFLDLTLKTKKPVVFTGSMLNLSDYYSDGPFNLRNAVIQVINKTPENWGVTVTLNGYINAAKEVIKTNTINFQTFESGQKGYLGYVFGNKVYALNDVIYHNKFPIPKKFPKIYIFQDFAGAKDDVLKFMANQNPDAIIVEALGAGNVSQEVYQGVKYALDKNILIVITSIVPKGGVFPVYGDIGGGSVLYEAGAIFSRYLRADKARILLLLAIAQFGKDKEKLANFLSMQ